MSTENGARGGRPRGLALSACAILVAGVVGIVPGPPGGLARAEAGSFVSLVPGRVLDTRGGMTTADGEFNGIGIRAAGSETALRVAGRAGVANDAKAVVLNVAVTESTSPGFVTVWPCGSTRPNASSLNYDAGQTISNAVTAQIGTNGDICIFTFSRTHVVVDVTGAYPSTAGFEGLVPGRVLETRAGMQTADGQFAGEGIRPAGSTTEVVVHGRAGAGSAEAVVLNVAVTGSGAPGFVTVWPCGQSRPNAASLNYDAGQTISNAVTAKVGTNGAVCIFVLSATHVIVDLTGAFPAGSGYVPLVPGRVLETRSGLDTADGQENGIGIRAAGSETPLPVAGRAGVGDVDAVVLNVAVTGSSAGGFVTIFPCGSPRPNASSLNFAGGQTISNAVTAKVGTGGRICIYVLSATHVVIDVTGWFPGATSPDPGPGRGADPTTTTAPPPDTTSPPATTTAPTVPPAGQKFQAVYLRAADSANVATAPAQIKADVDAVNGWFFGQTPGRQPNFVRDGGGNVTVAVIQVAATKAFIATGNNDDVVMSAIRAHPSVAGNYPVIYYEGATSDRGCGFTVGAGATGYVLIPYDNCYSAPDRNFIRDQGGRYPFGLTYLLSHEITHALGAVPSCAPNQDGTGHVNDSSKDVVSGIGIDFANLTLDVGRDDYYMHGIPGCPDIKDSPLLTP